MLFQKYSCSSNRRFFGLNPPSPLQILDELETFLFGFWEPPLHHNLQWSSMGKEGGGEGVIRVSSGNKQRDVQLKYRVNTMFECFIHCSINIDCYTCNKTHSIFNFLYPWSLPMNEKIYIKTFGFVKSMLQQSISNNFSKDYASCINT